MALFALLGDLLGFPVTADGMYASPQTLVRPPQKFAGFRL
jgi:hypothetical protein